MSSKEDSEIRRLYLNGQWVTSDAPLPVVDPATGTVVARVTSVGRDEVAQAIAAASEAWTTWRQVPGRQREAYLGKIADSLEAGTIGINDPVPATSQCPFGGSVSSSCGVETH